MKTSPPKSPPHETDEQKLDTPFDRIMTSTINTPAPTTRTDPWSIESQCKRDIAIVSTILARYCGHRDKLALRGNREIGIGELVDAMIDRADLACLFSSDQLAEREHQRVRGFDCGYDRDEECERFNKALK
jgi:hypothetical protein